MTTPRDALEAHANLAQVFRENGPGVHAWLRAVTETAAAKKPYDTRDLAAATRAHMMFFPFDPFTEQGLDDFAREVSRDLFDAQTLQVSSEIMQLLTSLPDEWPEGGELIMPDEIPWDRGFAWFDDPLEKVAPAYRTPDGEPLRIASVVRAISWSKFTTRLRVRADETHSRRTRAVRIMLWTSLRDVNSLGYRLKGQGGETAYNEKWEQMATGRDGDLLLSHSVVVPLGHHFEAVRPHPDDHTDEASVSAGSAVMMFMHRLWMFMDMEITTMPRSPVNRQGRKRNEGRLRNTANVRVILLRRAHKEPRQHDPAHVPAAVAWSCRWFVRGHYRHLDRYDRDLHGAHFAAPAEDKDHCEVCGTRISRWIHPYLKGPSGLPIRHADELFRLAR
jgi:hypothetical protein